MSDEYINEDYLIKDLQVQQISFVLRHPEYVSKYSMIKTYKMIVDNPDLFFYALVFNSIGKGENINKFYHNNN